MANHYQHRGRFTGALPPFAAGSPPPGTVGAMRTHHLTIPVLAVALAAAACGGASSEHTTSTAARPAVPPKPGPIPRRLVGTWTTTLKRGDIPRHFKLRNPFELRIAPNGGVDGAPSFTLADARETIEGEVSTPAFSHGTVTLRREGCLVQGVGFRFYDNVYRYTLSGDRLTFAVVRNACKDRFAERILTSRPFRRGTGS
jgi:hypothetical protein